MKMSTLVIHDELVAILKKHQDGTPQGQDTTFDGSMDYNLIFKELRMHRNLKGLRDEKKIRTALKANRHQPMISFI